MRNFVAEFDVKFIHKLCDRQKSAATLGTIDKKLACYKDLEHQFNKCICGVKCQIRSFGIRAIDSPKSWGRVDAVY
ncbi:hypothetical protein [Microcoleus sp. herbarium12]|jgi:hypothetical protein|uniref:hypothetical protein n=1 Tax=Microcoleus sp. herbarium12 TaxID=3055437 RepID=UPI002FD6CBC9